MALSDADKAELDDVMSKAVAKGLALFRSQAEEEAAKIAAQQEESKGGNGNNDGGGSGGKGSEFSFAGFLLGQQ